VSKELNSFKKVHLEIFFGLLQSHFNKVGHLLVCKQSKMGWEPQFLKQPRAYCVFVLTLSKKGVDDTNKIRVLTKGFAITVRNIKRKRKEIKR
jgi:hypothetical protein